MVTTHYYKIKETLLIRELNPILKDDISSENLHLYYFAFLICKFFSASIIIIVRNIYETPNSLNMRFIVMFTTAVCVLFIIKLRW